MTRAFDAERLLDAAARLRSQGEPRLPGGAAYSLDMAGDARARAAYMEAGADGLTRPLVECGAAVAGDLPGADGLARCSWLGAYDGLADLMERLAELEEGAAR